MRFRVLSTTAIISTLVMGLCAGSQARTTLRFIGNWWNVQDQISIFKSFVKEYNESQNNVKVELIMGGSEDKLRAMIAAGTAPDVVEFDRYMVAAYAREGLFAPLDSYLPSSLNPKRDFLPHVVKEATWKGKLYAVPKDTDIRGLFWNKRLLAEAGLDGNNGPRTWSQLREYAIKLTKKNANGKVEQAGFVPWGGNWYNIAWIWTFGGDYYNYQTGKPMLDTPTNRKALAWLGDWAKTIAGPSQLTSIQSHISFAKEKLAMEAAHYGALPGWYLLTNPKLQPNIGGGEVPHPDGGQNGTWSGGMSYVIPGGSRHKKEAAQFIAWLMSPANQLKYYKEIRQLPVSNSVLEKAKELMPAIERTFVAQLPKSRGRAPFTNVLQQYIDTAANDVISGKRSPETALALAQDSALKKHPSLWKEKVPYNLK